MRSAPIGTSIAEAERDLILATLAHCKGNRTHAAMLLDISPRGLRNKVTAYRRQGVAVPDHKKPRSGDAERGRVQSGPVGTATALIPYKDWTSSRFLTPET